MLDPKLEANLPRLAAENIGRLDNGSVARRLNAAIADVLRNISQFPFRDAGKAETRKVTMELAITPEIRPTKNGANQVDGYELSGLSVRVKIKAGLPDAESADVRMLVDMRGGQIANVLFNPDNNSEPSQLELFDKE